MAVPAPLTVLSSGILVTHHRYKLCCMDDIYGSAFSVTSAEVVATLIFASDRPNIGPGCASTSEYTARTLILYPTVSGLFAFDGRK